jgi:hypothetical protein
MKIIVTGGRDFHDRDFVFEILNKIHAENRITEVVNGTCPTGADKHSKDWAIANNVKLTLFPADWAKHGKKAGPLRNAEMANYGADLCLAFAGGKGTNNMINEARKAGVKVEFVGDRVWNSIGTTRDLPETSWD